MQSRQIIFIQDSLSGCSRGLRPSNARSHAARVGHLRVKSRHKSKDSASPVGRPTEEPGQAVTSIRRLTVEHPPRLPETSIIAATQHPLVHPNAINHCCLQGEAGGDHPQEKTGLQNMTNVSPTQSSLQQSYRTTSFETEVSLDYEGFPGLRTDPFFSIPKARDSRIWSAIDFYIQVICTGNDTICYVFDVSNVYASFLETLQDEVFFDVGVGLALFLQEQICNPGNSPSVYTLKHKGRAIAQIRNKLSKLESTVDDVTLNAMIFLAVLDQGLRNLADHEVHRRNIGLIVSRQGGLESLQNGSMLKGLLLHYDTFWSLETGNTMLPGRCRQYEPLYPTQPFSANLCSFATKRQMGFHQLVVENALSFSILRLLVRATHITNLSPQSRSELLAKTRQSPKRYNDFWEACPCLRTSDTSVSVLEKLLSLTLICYCYIAFGSRSHPTHLRVSRSEASKIIGSYHPRTTAEERCLIWMWIIITDSWRLGSRLQPNGVSLLFDLQSRFPDFRRVNAVPEIANRFLWTPDLNNSVDMYWVDLISTG